MCLLPVLLCQVKPDEIYLVVNAGCRDKDLEHIGKHLADAKVRLEADCLGSWQQQVQFTLLRSWLTRYVLTALTACCCRTGCAEAVLLLHWKNFWNVQYAMP